MLSSFSHNLFGAVAQLGEHKAGSLGVRGSIPLSSTTFLKIDTIRIFITQYLPFKSLIDTCTLNLHPGRASKTVYYSESP